MQTAADLRSHYDAVRARLMGRVPSSAGTPIVPVAPTPAAMRPGPLLRSYPHPIGPTQPTSTAITLKSIIRATCAVYALDVDEVTGPSRMAEYALPRQVAFYVARRLTGLSLPQIGMGFGGKDHTTVLHGIRKIEKLARADYQLRSRVEEIIQIVDGRARDARRRLAPETAGVEVQAEQRKDGITFTVPVPPSTNNLFSNAGKLRVRAPAYVAWSIEAGLMLNRQKPGRITGPFAVTVALPAKLRGDIDNRYKAIGDLMVEHGITEDDARLHRLTIERCPIATEARVSVTAWEAAA